MYEVVLLDLDLTLFDFHASEVESLDACLRLVGVEDCDAVFPRYREINRAQWTRVERGELTPSQAGRRRFEILLAEIGVDDADPADLSDRFQHGLGQHGGLYDGVVEVLDALADRVPLGLVTNGITEVQRAKVERLGLTRWFDAIVISDEVGVAKPDPTMFDLALERIGAPERDAAVMVGDSLSSDIAGATAAGIASCWYNPHGATAGPDARIDHEIRAIDELPDLITR